MEGSQEVLSHSHSTRLYNPGMARRPYLQTSGWGVLGKGSPRKSPGSAVHDCRPWLREAGMWRMTTEGSGDREEPGGGGG